MVILGTQDDVTRGHRMVQSEYMRNRDSLNHRQQGLSEPRDEVPCIGEMVADRTDGDILVPGGDLLQEMGHILHQGVVFGATSEHRKHLIHILVSVANRQKGEVDLLEHLDLNEPMAIGHEIPIFVLTAAIIQLQIENGRTVGVFHLIKQVDEVHVQHRNGKVSTRTILPLMEVKLPELGAMIDDTMHVEVVPLLVDPELGTRNLVGEQQRRGTIKDDAHHLFRLSQSQDTMSGVGLPFSMYQ